MNDKKISESGAVEDHLVGAAWPSVHPGDDPVLYGHVQLEPRGSFATRSLQTFKLTYTVGRYGIDDTGSIRIVFRFMSDVGDLQTANPQGVNYVTASSNTNARLSVVYGKKVHQRPWFKALTVSLHGGYLREGDTITIVFGDTSQGSPGLQMPTFVDRGFEFKVLADVCAVGHYYPLPETPHIAIVPDQPASWKAVLPTLRRLGEKFRLGLKAEDLWGNPTPLARGRLTLVPTVPVDGLPESVSYPHGETSLVIDDLVVNVADTLRIKILDENGRLLTTAGPLLVRAADEDAEHDCHNSYWGDLHGQSGESIGVTTSREYFDFARNKSFLDVSSHQANDFQVNNAFWAYLNELVTEYHEDQRFVVFPGYEWSGNTAVGGDRNVFFREEGRQIHRSSHALLPDRSDIDTDAPTASELFDVLQDEDCVIFAHVGGRYADIKQAHDGRLETAMEIHSAWGTFEWLLTDGFPLGHRCGVVCNSDGHKGRPGASYPGSSTFGAYGGLTCFLTDTLTRDGIFECLRRRHHYGTTGCRLHMEVNAEFQETAQVYNRDPALYPDAKSTPTTRVMMGDIVSTSASSVELQVKLSCQAPIERVEIRNAEEVVKVIRPYAPSELGNRIRVIWSGAEYRGRGRQSKWTGRAKFSAASIKRMEKINAWNHERKLEQNGTDTVSFDAITTGNFGGFDVWLDATEQAQIDITTNNGAIHVPLAELGAEDKILDAGGLQKQLRVMRLPEDNPHLELNTTLELPIHSGRDNPLWICVTTEDGFQAWSSPIFVFDGK